MTAQPPVYALRANDIAFGGLLRGIDAAGGVAAPVVYDWDGAPDWFSEFSRHFYDPIDIPNPFTAEQQAVTALRHIGEQHRKRWGRPALLIPSSDTNLMLLLNNEAELAPYFALMGDSNYRRYPAAATDKGEFFSLMQRAAPELCPRTFYVQSSDDIEAAVTGSIFPVVVKPAVKDYGQQFYRMNDGLKAITVRSGTELKDHLQRLLSHSFRLVVQELVEFESAQDEIPFYCYCDAKAELRVAATGIKTVIQPPRFGTATVLELSWHEELLPLARRVASVLGWRGTLMIEFINDQKDGRWKIIEINTRPWLFHDFYRQCGLPFVPSAVRDFNGGLNEALPAEGSIVVPQPALLERRPMHLDLLTLLTKPNEDAGLAGLQQLTDGETIIERLESLGGMLSFAQGASDDLRPIQKMLSKLCEQKSMDVVATQRLQQWVLDQQAKFGQVRTGAVTG